MRSFTLRITSNSLPVQHFWDKIIDIKNQPNWVKTTKSISAVEVKPGAHYSDVTTVLWIPLNIEHVITKIDPGRELALYLSLPAGGRMWNQFIFEQAGRRAILTIKVTYDLNPPLANLVVGPILDRRWLYSLRHSFPEADTAARIRSAAPPAGDSIHFRLGLHPEAD